MGASEFQQSGQILAQGPLFCLKNPDLSKSLDRFGYMYNDRQAAQRLVVRSRRSRRASTRRSRRWCAWRRRAAAARGSATSASEPAAVAPAGSPAAPRHCAASCATLRGPGELGPARGVKVEGVHCLGHGAAVGELRRARRALVRHPRGEHEPRQPLGAHAAHVAKPAQLPRVDVELDGVEPQPLALTD